MRFFQGTKHDTVSVPISSILFFCGGRGSGQQVLQRRVVQLVDSDDVIQVLQVSLRVSHEVGDSGPGEHGQVSQPLYIFVRHLQKDRRWVAGDFFYKILQLECKPHYSLHMLSLQGLCFHLGCLTRFRHVN